MSTISLVTGASRGLGRNTAISIASRGGDVIVTYRSGAGEADAVVAEDAVVAQVESTVGAIDVLVNNAGYGHEGTVEESPLADMRRQFDVNVVGAVAMIKAVLPGMRVRRSGHIINITSMGGSITMPGIAYYCGSKFALEGISDALSKELAPFNIAVTAVAPGSFRTDWAGRSMVRAPRRIADYDASFDPIRLAREEKNGKQLGDPAKAAQAMLRLIESAQPPAHLLLGSDALTLVRAALMARLAEMHAWEAVTLSTDG